MEENAKKILKEGDNVYILDKTKNILEYHKKAVVIEKLKDNDNSESASYWVLDSDYLGHVISYPESKDNLYIVTKFEYLELLNEIRNNYEEAKKEIESKEYEVNKLINSIVHKCGQSDNKHDLTDWKEDSWCTARFLVDGQAVPDEKMRKFGWSRACRCCGYIERTIEMPEEISRINGRRK